MLRKTKKKQVGTLFFHELEFISRENNIAVKVT
jgi:hypothetical protein